MKKTFLALLALATISPAASLRCRTVAVTNQPRVHVGRWYTGTDGCEAQRAAAAASTRLFGDVLKFGVQVQYGRHNNTIVWDLAPTPKVYSVPLPSDNTTDDDNHRLNPTN